MKNKVLRGVFVALLMLVVSVSASNGENAVPDVRNLSLNQAVDIALKANHEIELADLGVKKAELSLERTDFAKEKMLDRMDKYSMARDQDAALVIDVLPVQAQSEKEIADVTVGYTQNRIKYGVEAAYYGVLKADKLLEVSQASYKRAQEQWKQAQVKFNAGTETKIDVISAEAQLKSAEASVNEAEADVKKANMGLNQALNLNLETPLKLTDKFDFKPDQVIDTEKVFREMTLKDLPYVAAREGYNIHKVSWEYYQKYFTKNTFSYRESEYNFKEAEVNLSNADTELQLNIKSAYLDLKTAEDNYNVLSKSLEQTKEAYRLNKLRYDVGMATGYDLLNAEESLKKVDLGLLNALYNYNLAKAKFTYGIFRVPSM